LAAAKGTTVNYWSWGGSDVLVDWYNTTLADYLKDNYDVTLNFISVADTVDTVTQISSEMQAGVAEGSVDFLWLNGENFYTLMQANYLYGPMAQALPFNKLLDPLNVNNIYDTGVQIYGYEASWQSVYALFYGDTAKVSSFPKNTDEFLAFCQQYPGKVTYTDPFNYSGSTFVSVLFANLLSEDDYNRVAIDLTLTKDQLKTLIEPGLKYLRELNPYLWNEGKNFPPDSGTLSKLYADGEIYLGFDTTSAQVAVDAGTYPQTTRSFILEKCIQTFYYLGIPANAANKAGALVAINAMGEPFLQASDMEVNGFIPVLDSTRLTDAERDSFDKINLGEATIAPSQLEAFAVPLPSGRNIDLITEIWREEVVGK
jgi:putative spermidine/putrescine transport system substrate-binding protein